MNFILFIQNVYAEKKYIKKANKLCIMGQIVIESHSFMEYWQNRKMHVWQLQKVVCHFCSLNITGDIKNLVQK